MSSAPAFPTMTGMKKARPLDERGGLFSVYGTSFLISPKHQVRPDQNGQKAQIRPGKDEKIGTDKVEAHREIRLEGNEAGHGGDESTKASDIDAEEKRGVVFRIGREHDSRRDIAHDLRKEKGDPEFMSGKERGRSLLEPRDVRQISYRNEKREEEREQLVVDLEEGLPVKERTSRDDDRKEE